MISPDFEVARPMAAGAVAAQAVPMPLFEHVSGTFVSLLPWIVMTVTLYALGWVGKFVEAEISARYRTRPAPPPPVEP